MIRIRADGSRDTSYGTGGEADIALPAGASLSAILQFPPEFASTNLTLALSVANSANPTEVVRLLPNGQLDPSFGNGGVVALGPFNLGFDGSFDHVVYLPGGKLALAGIDPIPTATPGVFTDIVAVARLTNTGTLDTTFGGTGVEKFSDLSGANLQAGASQKPVGLFYQPNLVRGDFQILVLSQVVGPPGMPGSVHAVLDRLNDSGSLDISLKQDGLLATGITNPTGLITLPNAQIEVTGSAGVAGTSSLALLSGDGSLVKSLPIQGGIPVTYSANDKVYLFSPGSFSATRINSDLTPDATFGRGDTANVSLPFPSPPPGAIVPAPAKAEALAVGDTVLVGSNVTLDANGAPNPGSYLVIARLRSFGTSAQPGDYNSDGIADPTAYLPSTSTFVIKSSISPGGIFTEQFGSPGVNASIPVPGNYYRSAQDDIAVYLTGPGVFAIQDPNGNTPGRLVQFGSPGFGNSIPVPGDYYGTGNDDIAVYLPATGRFAIQDPTGQTTGKYVQFGPTGLNASIPVPGDYYGTGQTDIAVYITGSGQYAIQDPTGQTPGKLVPFGVPGVGQSIPAPGDYDGSGKTELAVYIPSQQVLIYRPANGGADVKVPFGAPGVNQTLIAPGDYTGDGKTDVAAYLPGLGVFAYRSSQGGPDVYVNLGTGGSSSVIPVTAVAQFPVSKPGSAPSQAIGLFPSLLGEPDAFDFLPSMTSAKKKAGDPSTS